MQTLSNVLVICFAIGIDGFSPLPFAPIHSLYGRSSGELLVEAHLRLVAKAAWSNVCVCVCVCVCVNIYI